MSGIGNYHYLYDSCTHIMLDIQDYTQVGLAHNPSNATILTLHTPYKVQRLELQLANGLDSILESKDRQRQAKQTRESTTQSQEKDSQNNTEQQSLDSLLTLKLINGGYKEKYWGFGEEDTQANLLHTNTESKESKETQEKQDKEKQRQR